MDRLEKALMNLDNALDMLNESAVDATNTIGPDLRNWRRAFRDLAAVAAAQRQMIGVMLDEINQRCDPSSC